ncbi:MAG: GNAT family N-acetyltransferase [Rhizobiales bacterium]|nr:GNAT family N-acetyltransferase [Hyphomicrobiales bacterium]
MKTHSRTSPAFTVAVTSRFDFLSDEYAVLFAESSASAFQHPMWLDAIYQKLVPHLKADPLIVTVRDAADGRLVMLLPLVRRRHRGLRTIEFADLGVSDYVAPVASDATIETIAADPFTCKRINAVLKPYDILRIRKLRSPSIAVQRLFGATSCSEMSMGAYAVPLGSDFATWRSDHMLASYRKELDKKSRQLHRKGQVTFERLTDVTMIKATFQKMQEYRRQRFDTGDLLQDHIYFDFYLDIATHGQASLSRVYSVLMDGVPIAGAMGLLHKGSLLIILTGFDHDSYKSQSLGSLLFEMVANHAISVGDRELDFTIGDEPYKVQFGAQKSLIYQILRSGSISGVVAGVAVQRASWIKGIAHRFAG